MDSTVSARCLLAGFLFLILSSSAAVPAAEGGSRVVIEASVLTDGTTVPDAMSPEGRSLWDLTAWIVGSDVRRTMVDEGAAVRVSDGDFGPTERWFDVRGKDAAVRWWFPERFPERLRPGARDDLLLRVAGPFGDRYARIRLQTVGIGWVHLPSGPREVVLQRAVLLGSEDGHLFRVGSIVHRWVDPRSGVVAEVRGPASSDGTSRLEVTSASYRIDTLSGEALMKIYVDELEEAPFQRINYGWQIDNPEDPGADPLVRHVTPEQYATIGDLIAASSWDFSQNDSGTELAASAVQLDESETCNRDDTNPDQSQCGYKTTEGRKLGRIDVDFDGPDLVKNNRVSEREDRATDVTLWLRGGAQNEGVDAFFGGGESRYCYDEGRTPVPLWRFVHQDAGGWYLQPGDSWEPEWADPENPGFACEQTLFNQWCGNDPSNPFSPPILYAKACAGSDGNPHEGTQSGEVLKSGVVTLPSGHTFNALLVRTVGDFCVYSGDTCRDSFPSNKLDESRTTVYLWQVPHVGTVAQLQSEQDPPDLTSWSVLDKTDFRFGLYPPVSIVADNPTDTTLDVSWNPGNDTRRLDGYRVYWDVDSGAASAYANSVDVPGAANTSTTLSGLEPGTTYFITVTSFSTYANPSRPDNPVTYESVLFPTQVSGDPDNVYPVEVQATTTGGACTPNEEVTGVTVTPDETVAGQIRVCWNLATDPCITGYRVLGASTPEAAANFSPLGDVGLETCWTGDAADRGYFLVVGFGTGGEGPWGHFGQ
jgi:hypothetical protein